MNELSHWRATAQETLFRIRPEVQAALGSGNQQEARRILREAYPFGERKHYPYKVWCEEMGRAFPGVYQRRNPTRPFGGWRGKKPTPPEANNHPPLFEE